MKWRRIIWPILLTVALIGVYNVAALACTSAKLLGFGRAFDLWRGPIVRSTVRIGALPADIYAGSQSHSPVLIVHGVNETGKNSPQLIAVAEALAGSGFRVVVPEFIRLTRQNVTTEDIDDVVSAFNSLHADAGIVCASYGCGPALIAAGRPEIRDRVRFLVVFGAYFDLVKTVRFIVTGPPTPLAYSKWIYMAANVDLIANEDDRNMLLAIAAEREHRSPEEWSFTEDTLGPDARRMLELFGSASSAEFDARLSAAPALQQRMEALSPSLHLNGIRARLIIVHMNSDPCIPSIESIRMARAAKSYGIPYNLTILSMSGHTTPSWPDAGLHNLIFVYLPQTWKFMRLVNHVLAYA